MNRRCVAPLAACVMAVMVGPINVRAQNVEALTKAIHIFDNYRIVPKFKSEDVRRDLAGQHDEPRGDRKARVAAHLRTSGNSAGDYHQGDADPTVPYTQGVRLREALDRAGVPNQHVTIPGGKHGDFTDAEMAKAYAAILSFLEQQKLMAPRSSQ